MRFFFLLSMVLTAATTTYAGTQVIFARDGSKVSILMMSLSENPDATGLFNSLNVAPEEMNGKLTKKIAFTDRDGVNAFDVVCAFSKVAPTGSCVSVLHKARDVVMNPSSSSAFYKVDGDDARKMASLFVMTSGSSRVYESSDHHFTLTANSSSSGTIESFTIEYR